MAKQAEKAVEHVVVIDHAEQARREAAARLAAADDTPLDQAKAPGGVYRDADGRGSHNAHGQAVDEDGTLLDGTMPGAVNAEEDAAWRKDMEKQRAASAKAK